MFPLPPPTSSPVSGMIVPPASSSGPPSFESLPQPARPSARTSDREKEEAPRIHHRLGSPSGSAQTQSFAMRISLGNSANPL